MNRDFKGVWIDREIWLDEKLTWMEKLFITEINSLDNEDGCYASNDYFAKFFQLSKGRCSQIINSLIEKKYISAEYIRDKSGKAVEKRVVKILKGGIKNTKGGSKYSKGGYLENDEDSNTKSNNTVNNIREGKPFKKPSVDEFKQFLKESKLSVDYNAFTDYYESKGWMIGKNKMKDWKAAVRTWARNDKKWESKGSDQLDKDYARLKRQGYI